MNGVLVDFSRNKWAEQRSFRLDRGSADALADLCRHRWPSNTAKYAAREWGLSLDEARGVVAGRASKTTIDKIYKRGGPPVFLAVLEEVWGQSIARYFIEMRKAHEDHGHQLASLFGDPGSGPPAPAAGYPGEHRLAGDVDRDARRRVGEG